MDTFGSFRVQAVMHVQVLVASPHSHSCGEWGEEKMPASRKTSQYDLTLRSW